MSDPARVFSDWHDTDDPWTAELTDRVRSELARLIRDAPGLIVLAGDSIDVRQCRHRLTGTMEPWRALREREDDLLILPGNHDSVEMLHDLLPAALVWCVDSRGFVVLNDTYITHGHQWSLLYGTRLHWLGDAAISLAGRLERLGLDLDDGVPLTAQHSATQRLLVDRGARRCLLDGQRTGRWQAVVHGHLHRPGLRPSGAIDAGHSTDGTARWVDIYPGARIVRGEA